MKQRLRQSAAFAGQIVQDWIDRTPLTETDATEALRERVNGRSVALVGNATSIFDMAAIDIDSHDVVIRINRGPWVALTRDGIGRRTDVVLLSGLHMARTVDRDLCVLRIAPLRTYMVIRTRDELAGWLAAKHVFPPRPWISAISEEVGAIASTGCMGVAVLTRLIGSGELHLYGFDFWRSPTTYNARLKVGPHKPGAEEVAVRARVPASHIHMP